MEVSVEKAALKALERKLRAACEKGRAELVAALIGQGAGPDAMGAKGSRPVHLAARALDLDVLEALEAGGADMAALDEQGCQAASHCLNSLDDLGPGNPRRAAGMRVFEFLWSRRPRSMDPEWDGRAKVWRVPSEHPGLAAVEFGELGILGIMAAECPGLPVAQGMGGIGLLAMACFCGRPESLAWVLERRREVASKATPGEDVDLDAAWQVLLLGEADRADKLGDGADFGRCARMLAEEGAPLDRPVEPSGYLPLPEAIRLGAAACAMELLRAGAMRFEDPGERHAFELAFRGARLGNALGPVLIAMVEGLTEEELSQWGGPDPDSPESFARQCLRGCADPALAERIFEIVGLRDEDPLECLESAMHWRFEPERWEMALRVLRSHKAVEPSKFEGSAALHLQACAMEADRFGEGDGRGATWVRALAAAGFALPKGSDLSACVWHAIHAVRPEPIKALSDLGVDLDACPDKDRWINLAAAEAAEGSEQVLAALLSLCPSADLEWRDAEGRSAFWRACDRGDPVAARLLVEAGARWDAPDMRGRAPAEVSWIHSGKPEADGGGIALWIHGLAEREGLAESIPAPAGAARPQRPRI